MKAWLLCACALLGAATPAFAQEKTGTRAGFVLKPNAKILLMRPEIKVGAQSTGGMFEPNADWTGQARENINRALGRAQGTIGNGVTDYAEPIGDDALKTAEYRALFADLATSVMTYQFFPGNRLPSKKRKGSFVWNIGPEIAGLPGVGDADYLLFVWTDDEFGSTGRKMLQLALMLARVPIPSGVHTGYAGLIDARTGELVWLNADPQMGGDVRTPDGATRRVEQLLKGFPGTTTVPAKRDVR